MSFDVSTTKIGSYLLVFKANKRGKGKLKMLISPHSPDDPCGLISTKYDEVGGMDYVIKRAKFGGDRLGGAPVRCQKNWPFPSETYMALNNTDYRWLNDAVDTSTCTGKS